MQKENTSFFLPAIGGIIFLLLIGAGLMYYRQNKTQERYSSVNNQPANNTSAISPFVSPFEKKNTSEIFFTISEPVDKATVTSPNLMIRGKTVASAEVSINDKTIPANANGDFSAQISLEEGDNYFAITAIDPNGNSSEKEIMVTYESQTP